MLADHDHARTIGLEEKVLICKNRREFSAVSVCKSILLSPAPKAKENAIIQFFILSH